MSLVHSLAALSFRFLSTVWSAYAIWRTEDIDFRFRSMITEGACGVDLFPGYFKMRIALQVCIFSSHEHAAENANNISYYRYQIFP